MQGLKEISFPNGSFLYTSVYLEKSFNFLIPIRGSNSLGEGKCFPWEELGQGNSSLRGNFAIRLWRMVIFPGEKFCHPPSAGRNSSPEPILGKLFPDDYPLKCKFIYPCVHFTSELEENKSAHSAVPRMPTSLIGENYKDGRDGGRTL